MFNEIVNDYITQYIRALGTERTGVLFEIEKEIAINNAPYPIIKPEVASLLTVILSIKQPAQILEIGTNVGYSAIHMAKTTSALITTIERDEKIVSIALDNIKKENLQDKITILNEDALNILQTLESSKYDVVFMDCAKGQYINLLQNSIRILKKDGILIADNILHNGIVAKSRYSIDRKNRTIQRRLKEFLWAITHDEHLSSSVIPIGDGISISFKK
ncbi:methyltransferase [Candidatus Epulonipiscioides gigas]|nr:methyltransferase [Epulopiscium sp. SCG-C07WGA-EpuloA2]